MNSVYKNLYGILLGHSLVYDYTYGCFRTTGIDLPTMNIYFDFYTHQSMVHILNSYKITNWDGGE